jgi:hypothetical protein
MRPGLAEPSRRFPHFSLFAPFFLCFSPIFPASGQGRRILINFKPRQRAPSALYAAGPKGGALPFFANSGANFSGVAMSESHELPAGATRGPIVSACEDRQTRETHPVEGPCPLCGKIQEYFSDELVQKERLRCRDCRGEFDPASFKPA